MLTVNTLGNFQVTNGREIVNDDKLKSIMLTKLFMYMIVYRDKTLTTEEIASALWQDEESDNPAGALKNLMYRLRKSLSQYFADEELIITNRGAYKWNPSIEVNLDVEMFERLINAAKQENVLDKSIEYYEKALDLYQGEFMPKLNDLHWILTLSTYYHSLYLTAVKALAELYIQTSQYEKMEKICTDALKVDSVDEQLYCYQIEARMRCGKIALAMNSYENAREIMEKELGVRKTAVLNKVYEELLTMSKGQTTYSMNEVREDIVEEKPEGVFLCGYPIFKEIYHLEARKAKRSGMDENLVLFTLNGLATDTKEVSEFRVKKAMKVLESVIKDSLRVGDVAAKYSQSQMIILLPTCDYDLALLVANRIISKFYDKDESLKKIKISINIEEITAEKSLVD